MVSIPKLQQCNRRSLGMDKQFHPTFYWACNYFFLQGLKLNHASKRGHRWLFLYTSFTLLALGCIDILVSAMGPSIMNHMRTFVKKEYIYIYTYIYIYISYNITYNTSYAGQATFKHIYVMLLSMHLALHILLPFVSQVVK